MNGLLLLAYGTPERIEDIPAYLADVREGKPVSDELIASLTKRYEAIGGASPLGTITRAQAKAVGDLLGDGWRVEVGMKHSAPTIEAATARLREAGADRIVALVLAPHTVFGYRRRLDPDVRLIDPWFRHPGYIEFMASQIRAAGKVTFTAHSLPPQAATGYLEALMESAALIASAAAVSDWTLAFQSASAPGWLGPDIGDLLTPDALVVPFGFVADHLEILYDLDVVHPGIRRTPMPNDTPAFIQCLAEIVEAAA